MTPPPPNIPVDAAGPGLDSCPLCASAETHVLAHVGANRYLDCPRCRLVHLPTAHHLDPAAERARYESHENDPADPAYRAFLGRLVEPLADVLPEGAEGLDFGSGPGPTVSVMMRERGFSCHDYDPFFAPDPSPLGRSYDFITCTEVVEHLSRPAAELARLVELLRPGGRLAVMTEILPPDQRFEEWWYARDPTHICFYRRETMEWIATHFGLRATQVGRNVTLFQRPFE